MALTTLAGYEDLRKKVRQTLLIGQAKIEQEKIRTYWQTGKLINDFILKGTNYAERGREVVLKLSKDLGVSERSLYETIQFAKAFPKVSGRALSTLTWSHLRKLATIPDPKRRNQLVKQTETNEWTSDELSFRLTKIKAIEFNGKSQAANLKPLTPPVLGSFWTYRIIRPELIHSKSKALLLDLGFQSTIELDLFPNHSQFKEGDIVQSVKSKSGVYSLEKPSLRGKAEAISIQHLYTYQTFVERVIDADTLKVEIDLGFKHRFRLTLRLRGIDAFEADTKEGKRARAFVESALANQESMTIKSTKDDKYGRYLADVFFSSDEAHQKPRGAVPELLKFRYSDAVIASPERTKQSQLRYLNQELLDRKFAVRV